MCPAAFIDSLIIPCQTICYSRLPSARNEDGLVALHFNKKHSQVLAEQEAIAKTIQDIVNTPSVQVMVDGVRPLPDDWYICMSVSVLYLGEVHVYIILEINITWVVVIWLSLQLRMVVSVCVYVRKSESLTSRARACVYVRMCLFFSTMAISSLLSYIAELSKMATSSLLSCIAELSKMATSSLLT